MMVLPPAARDFRRDTHWKQEALSNPLKHNNTMLQYTKTQRKKQGFEGSSIPKDVIGSTKLI